MSIEDEAAARMSARRLSLFSLDDFVVRPAVSWLVRDLIPANSVIAVFGPPKSGKTFAICDLAMCVAHGMHWHGHTILRPLRVALLAGEGTNGLRLRMRAWRCEQCTELRGDLRVLPQALSLPDRADDLLSCLAECRPDLVVIDTVNAYFGDGDENSTADMTRFFAVVRRIRDEVSCSVLMIHHTGLSDTNRARGSSVLAGAVDVLVQVAPDGNTPGLFGFRVIAARDFEKWEKTLSLRLRTAETGWIDDEGNPLLSCVVEASAQSVASKKAREKPAPATAAVLMEMAKASANGAPTARLSLAAVVKAAAARSISQSTAYRHVSEMVTDGTLRRIGDDIEVRV